MRTPLPAAAHLTYFGGRTIASAQVVQVLFGAGTYLPAVQGTVQPSLAGFYAQALQGSYIDVLSGYDTAQQKIGRGAFAGQVTIAPAGNNHGDPVDDTSIQAELSAKIGSGVLPAPDANTVYMINFPQGKQIVQGGMTSCTSGGFCGYHGTFRRNGVEVVYGVLPDLSPGSGCEASCGGGGAQFDSQTAVASHELFEAISDPEVGLAYQYGPPLGWYDLYNGEVGDICLGHRGTLIGGDGISYLVQALWSNASAECITHR